MKRTSSGMRKTPHFISRATGAALLLAAAGCTEMQGRNSTVHGANDQAESKALLAKARPAISTANAEWPVAMRTRDVPRLMQSYAQNAVLVQRGGKTVSGRAAIEEYYKAAFANSPPITDGGIVETGIATDGGMVYEWGYGNYTLSASQTREAGSSAGAGEAVTKTGYFLSVWRADDDGVWRIHRYLTF